jgi:hypothetical protein
MTEIYQNISITTISEAGNVDSAALRSLCRAAALAAFIMLTGMLVHNINAGYLEPTFLGFEDKARDYGDMSKIQNAIEACSLDALQLCSFKYSGVAHMLNGLLLMVLGVAVLNIFRYSRPIAAQFAFVAALVGGLGFLATGVTDIPGTVYASLLRDINPDYNDSILLMTTMIRGVVNIIGITGLGLFAAFTGKAALSGHIFTRWGAWYGFVLLVPALGGLISPIFGFMYLVLVLPWLFWLGRNFSRLARQAPV